MKPLSPRRRRIYVVSMILLFFFAVPLALFYASGYRYDESFGFVRTGGMYLSVPYDDAAIYLNGEEIDHTGFLNKGFYIADLAPASYYVRVEKDGSHTWNRTLLVEPQVVTKADVVLPPLQARFVRLLRGGITSSTTRGLSVDSYDAYSAAFRKYATSTNEKGVSVAVVDGNVYVRRTDLERQPPDNFCIEPSSCVDEVVVEEGNEWALSAGFFEGGIVYATRESGVHFSEIDVRPTHTSVVLYPKPGAGARIVNDSLIVKDGNVLYLLEEF